ncbi:ABC-ATPase domain-containing protein [Bacillaceae bacterium S4-13-56]
MERLRKLIQDVDGKGYKAYKSLQGEYRFAGYILCMDYIQGDPFASPSKIRIVIPREKRTIRSEWKGTKRRQIYIEDLMARHVGNAIFKQSMSVKGTGKSGLVSIDRPGQEILERTAVSASNNKTTICLSIGLPANGRRINGKEANRLLFQLLPTIMEESVFSMKDQDFIHVTELADQHDHILNTMKENDWISFVADGSVLPRESGVSNKPLKKAVPFKSPGNLGVSINLPHREEPLTGMALKKGITLIVGGGYHGKSTHLQAIERGVYPHIVGDGREYVLTDPSATKIRSEDGRQVTGVDISPFINNLPHAQDTQRFSTENASGSTSQAANVMEALEAGANTLLIDEDITATNFMIRDERMQRLVSKEKEPITPFIDQIKSLRDVHGISSILVMGGSGDYFEVADEVIMLDQYVPHQVTEKAKEIASEFPSQRSDGSAPMIRIQSNRVFAPKTIQSQRGNKSKIQAKGLDKILMGRTEISLSYVEQLVDSSQTQMLADVLKYIENKNLLQKSYTLPALLDMIEQQMDEKGLASFTGFKDQHPGNLARPRRQEIAATFNRMRTAAIKN